MSLPPSPLRIGLLLDTRSVPAWVYDLLAEIQAGAYAEIALVVLDDSPRTTSRGGRMRAEPGRLVKGVALRLEKYAVRIPRDPFARVSSDALLEGVPVLLARPQRTRFSDRFDDALVEQIRAHDLDVLIRLGFRILRGDILRAARHGVWSYHHGDNRINRGGPPGVWEVLEGHPVTGAIVQQLGEDLDNGRVLARSFAPTDLSSVLRNQARLYWKNVSMLPRELRKLHTLGPDAYAAQLPPPNPDPEFYDRPLYRTPTAGQALRLFTRTYLRAGRRWLRKRFRPGHWRLIFRMGETPGDALWRYRSIVPPPDRFWADPHLVQRGGRTFVFFEELRYATQIGTIQCAELTPEGFAEPPKEALSTGYHLAYPFLFEWEDNLYMIPDSGAVKAVDAYICEDFPTKWRHHSRLLDGHRFSDATLVEHEGRWWMFVSRAPLDHLPATDELHLYYADHPLSTTWTPHPGNPVVNDPRHARPGGALFRRDGRLYRPAQDCSRGYGFALRFQRIRTLTPTAYEEEEVAEIEPRWDAHVDGVHTYSSVPGVVMLDARYPLP